MAPLQLRIEPEILCGIVSFGTIDHIRVLQRALGLGEAKAYVDRCVFGGEAVILEMTSRVAAEALAQELAALPGPARVEVRVED